MTLCSKPVGTGWCPLPPGHDGRCIFGIVPPDKPVATCTGPDCSRPVRHNGLCATHYSQVRRTGKLAPIKPRRQEPIARVMVAVNLATAKALDEHGPTRPQAARAILEGWATRKG